jgi:hypothetical protein
MYYRRKPMDPAETAGHYADLLEDLGLPRFASAKHAPDIDVLYLDWNHGFTLYVDLRDPQPADLDASTRLEILGTAPKRPIDVVVPSFPDDPRAARSIPGVAIHHSPSLHPDDLTVQHGIPCTTPSRTLIDCAECANAAQLRSLFSAARHNGLLDPDALRASRARVEWRPSLAMLDEVIAEFCE